MSCRIADTKLLMVSMTIDIFYYWQTTVALTCSLSWCISLYPATCVNQRVPVWEHDIIRPQTSNKQQTANPWSTCAMQTQAMRESCGARWGEDRGEAKFSGQYCWRSSGSWRLSFLEPASHMDRNSRAHNSLTLIRFHQYQSLLVSMSRQTVGHVMRQRNTCLLVFGWPTNTAEWNV